MIKYLTVAAFTISLITAISGNIKAQPFDGFIRFDGVDDELSVLTYNLLQSNSDFTVEFWVRLCYDTLSQRQAVLGNGKSLEFNLFPWPDDSILVYQLCANNKSNAYGCTQYHQYAPDINWHHIAVVYKDAFNSLKIYLDGVEGGFGGADDFEFSLHHILSVGYSSYNPGSFTHFNGYMDELRISDTIRYTGSFTPPQKEFTNDPRTRALWHFNQTNPVTSVTDNSGNGFHLTAKGEPRIIRLKINNSSNVLNTTDTFDFYQWINCSDSLQIEGANERTFTPDQNGSYAVLVSDGNCPMLSECVNVTNVGMNSFSQQHKLLIYPNPAMSTINIELEADKELHVEVWQSNGIKMFTRPLKMGNTSIDIKSLPAGIYYLRFISSSHVEVRKIIKY